MKIHSVIPNILIVDDRPENLIALHAVLDSTSYNLIDAHSGEEALKHLMDKDFALILMDVQMPGLSGFETAMLIKKREKSHFVPLIFITASYVDENSSEEGYRIGAVDYILKPFNPEALKAKVQFFSDYYKINRKSQQQFELELETQKVIEVVSHDLKNPLSGIQLNLQILKKASLNPDGETINVPIKKIESIERSTKQMQRLIEDLLDLAKFEGSQVHLDIKPINISDLISEVIQSMRIHSDQKKINIYNQSKSKCCLVECDKERIVQVLTNLIGNAIKFSENGSTINVGSALIDKKVRINVEDSGIGIDPRNLNHVFDRFWQASNNTKHGSGLGLSISKWIVEAHGGKIWAENPGKGSNFIFELPNVSMVTS